MLKYFTSKVSKWKRFWIISLNISTNIVVTKQALRADEFIPYRPRLLGFHSLHVNAMKCIYVRVSLPKPQSFFWKIETFSITFFMGNCKPQTTKCHVNTALITVTVGPKSYRPKGQPRSTRNEFPIRATSEILENIHYGGSSVVENWQPKEPFYRQRSVIYGIVDAVCVYCEFWSFLGPV